jgi:molybdenum cofactor cytidylyltransferase
MAAGLGSRYRAQTGADKLMAPCLDEAGRYVTVLQQVLQKLKTVGQRRIVVTRTDNVAVVNLAQREGFEVLHVQTQGMGETLAQAVAATPDHSGWLIALGDMPFVQPETFLRIAQLSSPEVIVVPCLQGRYGNPVAFGRTYFQSLCALTGDRGGRVLFDQGELRLMECNDPGIFHDVDLPDDLSSFRLLV